MGFYLLTEILIRVIIYKLSIHYFDMQTPYRKPGKYALQNQDPFLSEEKLQKLQEKLDRLKKNRHTLAAEVSRLAELGDFSENVEYQLAKGKLRGTNDAILKLENQIKNAQIIKPKSNPEAVGLGHKVTIRLRSGQAGEEEKTYQILGSAETDPKKGIISQNSPLGRALLGKKIGETVEIELKDKKIEYKIIKIQ